MILRLRIAFLVGLVISLDAVYEGILSRIFQLFMGAGMTTGALFIVVVLGSPLFLTPLGDRWVRIGWWTLFVPLWGIIMVSMSWNPTFGLHLSDEELQAMIVVNDPVIWTTDWIISMFGFVFCPVLSFDETEDKRWF